MQIFDTTLRDGAQREGITYSVADKLAVARLLDQFGVGFIEGGWPGAVPKDTEFFARAQTELQLKHAVLVAFGSTRKAGTPVADDQQIAGLLAANTPAVCLVAKSDRRHVERALRTTVEENLDMVRDSITHLREHGRRVFVDCEHFFDGFRFDPDYTAEVVRTALAAGAERVVLCDTNGGMLPSQVTRAIEALCGMLGIDADVLGMHAQNDTACAVANTIAAVEAGVRHVQGTANGYGERPGNADLFAITANLQLKLGMTVLPDGCLEQMAHVSHAIAEIANIAPDTHQAYVGSAAFAHKAGLHASAIKVDPALYNHVDPAVVGNDMAILVTEMAGRASIELKSRELGLDLAAHPDTLSKVTHRVKELEAAGWSFEAADASFELLVRQSLGEQTTPFALESYRVSVEHREDGAVVSEATVKLRVRGERVIATAEGNGPVNALDHALRQSLSRHYPQLAGLELADYKVRILAGSHGTDAVTRVLVETVDTDGRDWTTVGVHENVVEASWRALVDALAFGVTAAGDGGRVRSGH
ncbi:2-isopropylmalate synthase [Catellatospora sp. TT07R-123]|uniref:citramalate synthase n=1 Tax=Catellatospora sp. TT07R-123 TaxID=2733863 RepID=UPI001B296B92|nr:citramalate synthase [Catellatospora sp. TT07R-123]GHJ45112.1 2-isopropylmalate synthase [Catellatospora sp. TT07R-123]